MGLNDTKAFTPEMWTQFVTGQGQAMQGVMNGFSLRMTPIGPGALGVHGQLC